MKWTPEGKKIGDKVAIRPYLYDSRIEIGEISGESRTQWQSGSFRIRKHDGKCVGPYGVRAVDVDDEVLSVIAEQERAVDIRRKHLAIAEWVDKARGAEVVGLLWHLVGSKIEGFIPGDVK